MAEAATTRPGGDGSPTTTSCLHADEHRTFPVAEGLILDLPRQAHRLRHRLVIFNELDLAAASALIDHRRTCRNAKDKLLVERTANGGPWKFADQRLRGTKNAAAWAADILTVDEEAWVAARNLFQGLIDPIEHTNGAWGTRRLDSWFLWEAIHVLQVTVRAGQRLPLHLLIDLGDLCPGLFFEAIDILSGQ